MLRFRSINNSNELSNVLQDICLVPTMINNANYPNHWIGRRGFLEWSARSFDLDTLDYFFVLILILFSR